MINKYNRLPHIKWLYKYNGIFEKKKFIDDI